MYFLYFGFGVNRLSTFHGILFVEAEKNIPKLEYLVNEYFSKNKMGKIGNIPNCI